MHVKSLQSHPTVTGLLGSSVHGILQARMEWIVMPSFCGSSWPRNQTLSLMSLALAGGWWGRGFFTTRATGEAPRKLPMFVLCATSLQSFLTLCSPMDCSPFGCSVHGILQARILKWVAMPFSRGSFQPRDQTHIFLCILHWQAGSLTLEPPGKLVTWSDLTSM